MVHRRVRGGKFKIKYVEKPCPVELGQEIDVTIIDLAPSGDGRLVIRGYSILVPKAKPRDCVKVKIISVGEEYAVGQII
ncbi:MAG: TRAM domain-containing protein [Nitrososphaerota archaeon]|jgi:predicted RNA-binding protein with TRAM domain|nr:TRAM domain-containing protein [Nitrososphaerota archaeon]